MKVSQSRGALLTALCAGLLLSFGAVAKDDLPDITEEGLHRIKDSNLAIVYAKPEVNLAVYSRIWLLEPTVAFRKNWQRDQNRGYPLKVSNADMENIKSELAKLFDEVFRAELSEGGYVLVDEAADDVLLVRPAIVNLDVRAPDTMRAGRSYQYSESSGEMTLYLEIYDSTTGDLLGKALDRQADRERGYFQWQTRVTNRAAADRILKGWAKILREGLDEAHAAAGTEVVGDDAE